MGNEICCILEAPHGSWKQERPLLGCFLAGLVIQRNKTLRDIGFSIAFQCSQLMVTHLSVYSKPVEGFEIAKGRRAKSRIDASIWHSVIKCCLDDSAKTLEESMRDHQLNSQPTAALQVPSLSN